MSTLDDKQTTTSSIRRIVWRQYSILPIVGTARARESETSIRERINSTTTMASTTPLQKFEVGPKAKDERNLIVSELRDISFISGRVARELTISGSTPALSVRWRIVW